MADGGGSTAQLAIAGFCVAMFTIALGALITSQLALMSVLDSTRAERVADQIATSRFTADVIAQTVERAVTPLAGADVASQLATITSTDPQVTGVVSTALIGAHRQVVDPDVAQVQEDGNVAVRTAIAQSVLDAATAAGFDPAALGIDPSNLDALQLDAVAEQAGLPPVVPTNVPRLGLRRVAETTRIIAGVALFVFGLVAVVAHPRSGRGLRRLGIATAIVSGAWLVGLLVTGWIIGLVADTLFGEMLQTVWDDAVPTMLLLVGAGVMIGAGVVFAGIAADGWARERERRRIW
ncbi:MAG TPA: hypothetical protein VLN74_10335 [Ilumatobacteraceae bacterium]|nr:hypothetical protein [Ilumatobacteraceae bacterium]